LRGGIGSTTLAVNLAFALRNLWSAPTLLLDMVMLSGHVNLFLDRRVKHTWASLYGYAVEDFDDQLLLNLVQEYENGLEFVAAPTNPGEAELVSHEAVSQALSIMKPSYDYIVVDLPHNFDEMTLEILDQSQLILSLVAPDLASLRAAALTIDTYDKLEYEMENVQLVLNRPFAEQGVAPMDIFRALKHSIAVELPYAGDRCVQAINNGIPLLKGRPEHETSRAIENFAFDVSKSGHREFPPISPSEAWRRVQESRNPNKLLKRVGRIFSN
jgi:pilus assembly protein CpaE